MNPLAFFKTKLNQEVQGCIGSLDLNSLYFHIKIFLCNENNFNARVQNHVLAWLQQISLKIVKQESNRMPKSYIVCIILYNNNQKPTNIYFFMLTAVQLFRCLIKYFIWLRWDHMYRHNPWLLQDTVIAWLAGARIYGKEKPRSGCGMEGKEKA